MSHSYTVTASAGLALPPQTPVKLSRKQLALRSHQVVRGKGGFHTSPEVMTFKRGEVLIVEGELPKAVAERVGAPGEAAGETQA